MPAVTVIGAGPAGSLAALLLARAGHTVDLVEQHRFPRDKVCGECLSALGFDVLRRAGLERSFSDLAPVRLTRTLLHATDGTSARVPLDPPMWGISRRRFDDLLLSAAARERGVTVRQPMRCESIESNGAPLAVRCRALTTNRIVTFRPDRIVIADGKAALLAPRPEPTRDLGIKAHFAHVDAPRDAIQLFAFDGHYGGVAPIEEGLWNVALSVPVERVRRHAGDCDALLACLFAENRALRKQFTRAMRVGDWLASPLPRFSVVDHWQPNVIPIGNAAAAIEPIGGEGMGLAMRSAELAAEAITGCDSPSNLRRRFTSLWRSRRFATRAAAMTLSSRRLAAATIGLTGSSPHLSGIAMRWMGK